MMSTLSRSNPATWISFAIVVLCAFGASGGASAMSPRDCVKIQAPTDRLACFDKIFAPEKPVANPGTELRDITVDENARLDKSMRSICGDCLKK